jgi:hypothetical protein
MQAQWYMAGTEGTGEYLVVLRTRLGRVGYRDLNGSYRIRVEPKPEGRDPLATVLTQSSGWKQPGDQGQDRFSIVVQRGQLFDVLGSAIEALEPVERGAEVNPSAPQWAQQLVKQVRQSDRQRPLRNREAVPSQEEKDIMPRPTREQVFISYSHKDKKWLEKLQIILQPWCATRLFRCGMIRKSTQAQYGGRKSEVP